MAGGFNTLNNEHLIRTDLWSAQLKTLLLDDLFANRFVRTIVDFPDGNQIHIPSLGEATQKDFNEGDAIKYERLDTGDFIFEIDQYKYSAQSMSAKFKRDSFYASEVIGSFVPRQHRALMEGYEARVFNRANAAQTASNPNTINGMAHRFVGSGTGERITLEDFARARLSLFKANVPMRNLVAVVDPTVAYILETQSNVTNLLSPMPKWGDMINTGISTGMNFRFNIFGFDVYESNYLPNGLTDSIENRAPTNGVANYFFSAGEGDLKPWVGAWRQMPTVESKWDMDTQEWRFSTICEYGIKLFRPENLVTVITDLDVVS